MEEKIRKLDTVTTVVRIVITILFAIIAVIAIVEGNSITDIGSGTFENMPDGSGPGDGYIVIGKLFVGMLGGLGVLFVYILGLITGVLALAGVILSSLYLIIRNSYKKTQDIKYLYSNLKIKSVVNAINIALMLWCVIEIKAVSIFLFFMLLLVALEVVLVKTVSDVR